MDTSPKLSPIWMHLGIRNPALRFWRALYPAVYPESNSEFAPENGWLEYDRFLLGWPAMLVFGSLLFNETTLKSCVLLGISFL